MPLMINAIHLIPLLQVIDIYREGTETARELMINAGGDLSVDYFSIAEQSQESLNKALLELAEQVRILVDEADVPEGVSLSKFE